MLDSPIFDVVVDDRRITVSVEKSQIDVDELLRFVDFLRIQAFLQRNSMTEEEISTLAQEVQRKTWQRVKRRLIEAGKGGFLPEKERQEIGIG